MNIQFPTKTEFLFDPQYRYYVLYGGRASAKSWSAVRALILLSMTEKLRILAVREFMSSISHSIHQLICDQIIDLELSSYFDTTNYRITGRNGSEWIFAGIRNDPTKVKSTEGIDWCLIEEAESISERSWRILLPTIRKPNSKIIVVFNPYREEDPTYQRFIVHPPPNTRSQKLNYLDNPFCPQVSIDEANHCLSTDPEMYSHIWLGECIKHSDAIVFNKRYKVREVKPKPEWNGPYMGTDFGDTDPTTLVRCWVYDNVLYIDREAYGTRWSHHDMVDRFTEAVPDIARHIIRADCARPDTIRALTFLGLPKMVGAIKGPGSVMDGIAYMKSFKEIIIDPRCTNVIKEFGRYSYKVDKLSGDVLPDIASGWDHTIDAIRYACEPLIKNKRRGSIRIM